MVRSVSAHSPSGTSSGHPSATVDRRPCVLPDAARAAATVGPTAHPEELGTATSASPGAVSSANPPAPAATSAPTRWGTPPSIPARLAASARDRLSGVSPLPTSAQASKIVRHPVHRQRWASSARPTTVSFPRSEAASEATRMMIPGVQNPHWLAPVAVNAFVHSSRIGSGSPSRVVISRPATRDTGVTQATRGAPSTHTVQQPHWPCGLQPSFADRSPRWSRSASSSDPASSGTVTGSPLTRSAIPAGTTSRIGSTPVPALSRRTFLAGGLAVGAAGFVLAACGSDDSSESSDLPDATSGTPNSGDPNRPDLVLVRFTIDGVLGAGIPQRIPVGLADADGPASRRHPTGADPAADVRQRARGRTDDGGPARRRTGPAVLPRHHRAQRSRHVHAHGHRQRRRPADGVHGGRAGRGPDPADRAIRSSRS